MSSASDKIKARRKAQQEQSHIIEQSPAEKIAAIDTLFSSLPSAPPAESKAAAAQPFVPKRTQTKEISTAGVEIFSTFGGGSILVDGKSVTLPFVINDPIKLLELKALYQIDAPNSILKSRRIG